MSKDTTAVIIPTYVNSENRFSFFKQTIASLVRQTSPVVGIIVDDGSPMSDCVKNIVNFYNFKGNLRYVKRPRKETDLHTASNAINFGLDLTLDLSSGIFSSEEQHRLAYAAYLHSDDMLPDNGIAKRVAAIKDGGFVFSKMLIIDDVNRPKTISGNVDSLKRNAQGFPHHSSLWSLNFLQDVKDYVAETYNQESIFDSRICFGEDRDVSLSSLETLTKTGQTFTFVPSISYFYRAQEDSITGRSTNELISHDHRLIASKHGFPIQESTSNRLFCDMPWSLFYFLPPTLKKHFRGPRDYVKRVLNLDQFDEYKSDPLLKY